MILSPIPAGATPWCTVLNLFLSICIFCVSLPLSLGDKDGSKVTTVVATPGQGPDRPQEVSYTDTKVIGNGSFGVVYQAKLCDSGELVAIKKVLQDKRFKVKCSHTHNVHFSLLDSQLKARNKKGRKAAFTKDDDDAHKHLLVLFFFFFSPCHSFFLAFSFSLNSVLLLNRVTKVDICCIDDCDWE